ncbi:unnamed protein product, partial [Hapterophycus canaliculatus]
MTFDSKDELYKIRRLLDSREKVGRATPASVKTAVQMVLRLRVPDSYSDCPLGEKYGAAEEACSELITLAVELGLPLVGISFHCGSGCQNAQAYPQALMVAKSLFDLAARQGATLTLLDIGGGFPGWDGSECVYHRQPGPRDTVPEATDAPAATAAAASAASPSAEGQCLPCHESTASGGDGASRTCTATEQGSGDAGYESQQQKDGVVSEPSTTPPLSLAEIARVTLPVLDELFPPSSGVQVIAEPGRYFVEASHVLFARIYAKRSLALQGARDKSNPCGNNRIGEGKKTKTTAYYIDEGVNGCFKDKVLCGVNFEPCPVALSTGGRRCRGAAVPATATPAPATPAKPNGEGLMGEMQHAENMDEEEEDAVVMGPSGLPADVVARKRLPKSLKPGDWLYFSRMGAYTASIATVASSAVLEASYCYVASTPAKAGE